MSDDKFIPPEDQRPTTPLPESGPPAWVGKYRVLQKIGEGGMGEVYLAEQVEPIRRRAALKIIRWGMDTKSVVARFDAERQALALMDHPNVAKVLDAGATEGGRPYFIMEYVKGAAITQHCDRHRLSIRERLELFIQVCDGVQHAHQKGIIHRDIKPSNVLVQIAEGDKRVAKIIDFGVAKATAQRLTERTIFTELGQFIGTPEYMSPEQAEMNMEDIDTRTDLYSLGVLLYELLLGELPLNLKEARKAGYDEIRRKIREDQPLQLSKRLTTLGEGAAENARKRQTDPRALRMQLLGDLDWITLKALEKDRTRRYGSPSELSADIARHLCDEPVLAGPPSASYRVGKFVRRHRAGAAVALTIALALLGGILGTSIGLMRARHAQKAAIARAEGLSHVFELLAAVARDEGERSREILQECLGQRSGSDPYLAWCLAGMAWIEEEDELYAQAELSLQRALTAFENLPEQPPEMAFAYDLQAVMLHRQGKITEVIESITRALEIREVTRGPSYPETLRSLYERSTLHFLQQDMDSGWSDFEEAIRRGLRSSQVLGSRAYSRMLADPRAKPIADEMKRRLEEPRP